MKHLGLTHPDIAKEWHPEKNKGLSLSDVSKGMHKKVWWRCKKGHEWQAYVFNRARKKSRGCPFCAGKRVTDVNRLDLRCPHLKKQWGPKNSRSIDKYSFGSSTRVWWICANGHEWQSSINNRTSSLKLNSCPYCSGKRVGYGNSLAENDVNEICKEWNYQRNAKGPHQYTRGSGVKVWWICSNGHKWDASICSRAGKKRTGCPTCSGKIPSERNRFDLHAPSSCLEEWDHDRNKIKPNEVTIGSTKKIHWKCVKDGGHLWINSPNSRIGNNSSCPFCSGRKLSKKNRFDICASREVIKEWNHEKNKIEPHTIHVSSPKKVWWKCTKFGHEWKATVNNRTRKKGSGCPKCQESRGEKKIRYWLKSQHIEYIAQYRLNPRKLWRYDFYLPKMNIAIEFDGIQHFELGWFDHSLECLEKRKHRDMEKTTFCLSNNIYLIRISHLYFDAIDEHLERALTRGKYGDWCLYFTGDEYKGQEKQLFDVDE